MYVIVRVNMEDMTKTPLPGGYDDEPQAKQALAEVLAGYAKHGQGKEGEEHGYWWAKDDKGRQFRFILER